MAATTKAFLLVIMLSAVLVTQTTARDAWYKQYYSKKLPGPVDRTEEHDSTPIKGNFAMFNPWISPLARKYRLMRLGRSLSLSDGL